MTLSPQDLHLLKELKAAGERGRNIQASHIRVVLDRLARGGFVVGRPMGGELVNCRITQPVDTPKRVTGRRVTASLPRQRLRSARDARHRGICCGGVRNSSRTCLREPLRAVWAGTLSSWMMRKASALPVSH